MSATVLNNDTALNGKTLVTAEGDNTLSGANTFTGANSFAGGVADGSVGAPSLGFDSDPDTGLYRVGANVVGVAVGGVAGVKVTTPSSSGLGALIEAPSGTFGSAAGQTGSCVKAGRNVSGAPGLLALETSAGVTYYLWVSTTGKLYISTAYPEADGTPSDTSGTVVGSQT